MKLSLLPYYFTILIFFNFSLFSQNETKKWYFGAQAGLDFSTTPPTVLTNGALTASYSCASIADAAGNLLFYTDGQTVYNSSHAVMSNGTGLFGNNYSSQGSLIVKQPGNTNIYYIFNTPYCNTTNCTTGINYSIVDMSLSTGSGSVTVKNANLYTGYVSNKLTATRHCNGVDIWILTRDWYSWTSTTTGSFTPTFMAYLLTSTGVSTTAVTSSANTYSFNSFSWTDWGCMKLSPNGKKLALGVWNNWSWTTNNSSFELYDFDNTTGIVSNSVSLATITSSNSWYGGYGVEFSPDGTKLYGGSYYINSPLFQWDICAGTASAIAASVYTVATSANYLGSLQLASDGKIYCAQWNQGSLSVINNPNGAGAACNFSVSGQSVSPKTSAFSLPNFMSSNFIQRPPPTPFTHTVSNSYGCQAAQFNTTYNPSVTVVGCAASGYSLSGLQWTFGDPASGASNTSTLVSPIHAFTTLGTYSVQLVLYYSCGGGTDTLKQVVNINQPCISVNSTSITCANLGSATVAATGGIGPFSYTWMPSGQTNSVATGLSPGTYTLTVFDFGNNFTYTATTLFTSLIPLTGNLNNSSSVTCNGASTGTANFTGLSGGSGVENYLWTNGVVNYTVPVVNALSAGLWSVTVTDALTGCNISQVFYISQPPAMNLTLSSTTPTTCAGTSVALTGTNSGGTPGYTYSWVGGAATNTRVVSQAVAGIYIYTLTSKDSYSCAINNTIAIDFIQNPVLSVSNVSICPLETGTLTVSGASTYTWNNSLTTNTLSDNPMVTTNYSVVGAALGCTSIATASIILKPLPVPLLNSNGPVCNGQNLQLFGNVLGNGAATYVWTGPLSFTASQQYPSINPAVPGNSGVYNFTVTAANSCTAATSGSVTVNPTPTVSAFGSTVCVNHILSLTANSLPGSSFLWSGPPSFTSNLQNPTINNPPVSSSGIYTVKATSAVGCTNTAVADVTVTALPIPLITSDSPECFGGTVNFIASGGVSYSWNGPNGFNSVSQNPIISNVTVPASGIYTLLVTTGPCVVSATHPVTVYPLPAFTPTNNSPVCESKSFTLSTLSVPNATSYVWQGPLYNNPSQVAVRNQSQLSYAGIYTLTVQDIHSCVKSETTQVTVLENPTVTALSTTVCLNKPATLMGSGAETYSWTGPGFYVSYDQNAFIPEANNISVAVYTMVGGAANSCTSTVTASITTQTLPTPSLTVSPNNTICVNSKLSFEGFGGLSYQWFGPDNISFEGKTFTLTPTNTSFAGTYTLVAMDDKGCTNFTTTHIYLNGLPYGYLAGTKMDDCIPFSSDFSFASSASNSSLITTSWQINNGQTINGKTFSRTFKEPGDYYIKGFYKDTVSNCTNTATFVVHARPLPVANFSYSPEKPIESVEDVLFTSTSTGEEITNWDWFFIANDGPVYSKPNVRHFFKDAGIYPVALVVKNTWGCADSIVQAVRIEVDFNIYVPDAFTPNGDNLNETFQPVLTGTKLYELTLFDRWGKKVFQTSELEKGWDGSYNGEACKTDVYIWKIKLSTIEGEMKEYTGHVTLSR